MASKKISIVMAYLNRKPQLLFTLKTINLSRFTNFEVIIVDDGSDDVHRLEDIVKNYKFPINLIRIDKEKKTWINPCIAYNKGFAAATGEIIVIQNPECCHIGDCLTYINNHLTASDYMTFSCFSLHDPQTNDQLYKLWEKAPQGPFIKTLGAGSPPLSMIGQFIAIQQKRFESYRWKGWYNHNIYNPRKLHFMSATFRSNIEKIGGFDENYANGLWFDDNEFFVRISAICNSTIVPISENVLCIHQFHGKSPTDKVKVEINNNLYKKLLDKVENKQYYVNWKLIGNKLSHP